MASVALDYEQLSDIELAALVVRRDGYCRAPHHAAQQSASLPRRVERSGESR